MSTRASPPAPTTASPILPRTNTEGNDDTAPIGQRYWNVNVPPAQWTEACPTFLLGEGEKNRSILATRDQDFVRLSWAQVRELIASDRIDLFRRLPSQLRRYREYVDRLQHTHGSILSFIQHSRLDWPCKTASGNPPFDNPSDYRILFNDWPYGIDEDVTHLVVWTKFALSDDEESGMLSEESRQNVEKWVRSAFCNSAKDDDVPAIGSMKRKDVIWFKNSKDLKSVHALEHFHVMLYRAPQDFLHRITNGDRPMSEQLND